MCTLKSMCVFCLLGIQPLQLSFDMSLTEDKPEAPGETPDPQAVGLSGTRPLGLGVAVLPPLPPDTTVSMPILPSAVAQKKRSSPLPTPPPPPRLDVEVCVFIIFYSVQCIIEHRGMSSKWYILYQMTFLFWLSYVMFWKDFATSPCSCTMYCIF